jgi:hypothetical protein
MKTVELPNGRTAVSFVPEDSKDLAIVHIATIERLAKMLATAPIQGIIAEMQVKLEGLFMRQTKYNSTNPVTLEEYISVLEDDVNFHKTINLIQEYKPEPIYVGNLD